MNFLAHLLLTKDDEDFTIGNFIADSVKSSQWPLFKESVVKGIKIHHKIDAFTDSHPIVKQTKQRLRPKHGKYSPVIGDIVYDHFLAASFSKYSETPLDVFAQDCYALFHRRWDELPEQVQHMTGYMQSGNWLFNYGNEEGLHKALSGMGRRASFSNKMHLATGDVFANYHDFNEDFNNFFPELQDYIASEIIKIKKV